MKLLFLRALWPKNRLIVSTQITCMILWIFSFGIIFWRLSSLPPLVPLWYSKPWGLEQLAHPYWLFLLPVSSILWHMVNIGISVYVTAQYLTFTQFLFITSLFMSILSTITLIKIIFLVS